MTLHSTLGRALHRPSWHRGTEGAHSAEGRERRDHLGIAMTEPDAGSDLAGIKTRAEDRGDHWLLNGSKTYISNGQIGDLFIVVARTDPTRSHGMGLFWSNAAWRASSAAAISRRWG